MSKVFHQTLSTVMQHQSKFKLLLIGKVKSNTNKLLLIIMHVKAFVYGGKLGNKLLQISAC
mgnify:CR=1 FL=1